MSQISAPVQVVKELITVRKTFSAFSQGEIVREKFENIVAGAQQAPVQMEDMPVDEYTTLLGNLKEAITRYDLLSQQFGVCVRNECMERSVQTFAYISRTLSEQGQIMQNAAKGDTSQIIRVF